MQGSRFESLRALLVLAMFTVALFVGVATAAAAPVVKEAAFTNPVAYELKSLLTTRFYCTVDTPGSWATLTVSNSKGVVKTLYSGAINTTSRTYFPAWNGLDSAGKRLPTASYDWKLTITKGGSTTVKTGKITVSKVQFFLKGDYTPSGNLPPTPLAFMFATYDRYMIDAPVNIYYRVGSKSAGSLTTSVQFKADPMFYRQSFSTALPAGKAVNATKYLHNPYPPKKGTYKFMMSTGDFDANYSYYFTVIQ